MWTENKTVAIRGMDGVSVVRIRSDGDCLGRYGGEFERAKKNSPKKPCLESRGEMEDAQPPRGHPRFEIGEALLQGIEGSIEGIDVGTGRRPGGHVKVQVVKVVADPLALSV